MNDFTVISWANKAYRHLFEGLRQDCEKWGYPCFLYSIDEEYPTLLKAWCNHPKIIRKGVEDYGTVLFLDAECRIVAPIPVDWQAPLISIRQPAQKFWLRYNSGTVLADQSCISWLDAWIRVVEAWDMENLESEDYIHWPGDLNDEVALAAALAVLEVRVNTALLEYIDRSSTAEIARGLWRNAHTIIQHPTIHHWPKEKDLNECKKLFIQNYPGDVAEVPPIFQMGNARIEIHNWVFDGRRRLYAPIQYWSAEPRLWIDAPIELTSSQR